MNDKRPKNDFLTRLVGSTNEDVVLIEGVRARALVDSGSMVSTISVDFHNQLSPCPEIHQLQELDLQVEGANGQEVPYLGYIDVKVGVPF